MTDATTIDIAGLVEDGLLDLELVFHASDWDVCDGDPVATYTACVYGDEGDEPGECEVVLKTATEYGITAYRWAAQDETGGFEDGPIVLDADEARDGGAKFAAEKDEGE